MPLHFLRCTRVPPKWRPLQSVGLFVSIFMKCSSLNVAGRKKPKTFMCVALEMIKQNQRACMTFTRGRHTGKLYDIDVLGAQLRPRGQHSLSSERGCQLTAPAPVYRKQEPQPRAPRSVDHQTQIPAPPISLIMYISTSMPYPRCNI